jgi:transcriptional repressor NrdR
MVCIYCSQPTRVVNSRKQKKLKQTWRRRKCTSCGSIFTTIEKVDLEKSLIIEHNSKSLEPFRKEKLLLSIYSSLGHRKTALNDSVYITDTIVSIILSNITGPSVNSSQIRDASLGVLTNFDKTAAVYYKAYY